MPASALSAKHRPSRPRICLVPGKRKSAATAIQSARAVNVVLSVDDFQAGFRRFVWCSRQMRKNVCPKLDRSEPKGAAALCGIKAVGGIAIAQKLSTAKQPDMPGSALGGCRT